MAELCRSDFEARLQALYGTTVSHREHRYVGGPPSPRIKRMQLAHEARARRLGIRWDLVDLRTVYSHHQGLCGICKEPVGLDVFAIDHIIPTAKGGPHLFGNLQPAHRACNSQKGDRT